MNEININIPFEKVLESVDGPNGSQKKFLLTSGGVFIFETGEYAEGKYDITIEEME